LVEVQDLAGVRAVDLLEFGGYQVVRLELACDGVHQDAGGRGDDGDVVPQLVVLEDEVAGLGVDVGDQHFLQGVLRDGSQGGRGAVADHGRQGVLGGVQVLARVGG